MDRRDFLRRTAETAAAASTAGLAGADSNDNYKIPRLWDFRSRDVKLDDDVATKNGVINQSYSDYDDSTDMRVGVSGSEFHDLIGAEKDNEDYWTANMYGILENEKESLREVGGQLLHDVSELTRYTNAVLDKNLSQVYFEIKGDFGSRIDIHLDEDQYTGIREGRINPAQLFENEMSAATGLEPVKDQRLMDEENDATYEHAGVENTIQLENVIHTTEPHAAIKINGGDTRLVEKGGQLIDGAEELRVAGINPSPRVKEEVGNHLRLEGYDSRGQFNEFIQ